jgi:hypothetical protein
VVFKAKTLPKFALMTQNALPNTELLNGDCFGVLVSLTFNRGASYSKAHNPATDPLDRYREMRAIKSDMAARNFADIPNQIRAMIRIWVNTDIEAGMRRRRDDEADLFVAGLGLGVPVTPSAVVQATPLEAGVASAEPQQSDDDVWVEVTDDDIAAEAIAGTMFTAAAVGAKWANDDVQPDCAHLGSNLPTGVAGQHGVCMQAERLDFQRDGNSHDKLSINRHVAFKIDRRIVGNPGESADHRASGHATRDALRIDEAAMSHPALLPLLLRHLVDRVLGVG